MSYVQKVTFFTKLRDLICNLPPDIQKHIGSFYNKKYDNKYVKYVKLLVFKVPKIRIPEQILIKNQIVKQEMLISQYNDQINRLQLDNFIHKSSKLHSKKAKRHLRCRQRKFKKHIVDGRKLKEINNNTDLFFNPKYFEYYCNNCKMYYYDMDKDAHTLNFYNMYECSYNYWNDYYDD
jgi:hypothetical protein